MSRGRCDCGDSQCPTCGSEQGTLDDPVLAALVLAEARLAVICTSLSRTGQVHWADELAKIRRVIDEARGEA